jgi:hypothetical protein
VNGKREKKENDILGAMTFEEIGRELGISGNGAWMLYKNALRKLRRLPGTHSLLELARSKDELLATDRRIRPSTLSAASAANSHDSN